jgi:hypothetical protein
MKEKILAIHGIKPNSAAFIFAGKGLCNDRALYEYNIQDGSTLHMVTRLK